MGSVMDRAALEKVSSEYVGFSCHTVIKLIGLGSTPVPQINYRESEDGNL
jgi:hypothetical protein